MKNSPSMMSSRKLTAAENAPVWIPVKVHKAHKAIKGKYLVKTDKKLLEKLNTVDLTTVQDMYKHCGQNINHADFEGTFECTADELRLPNGPRFRKDDTVWTEIVDKGLFVGRAELKVVQTLDVKDGEQYYKVKTTGNIDFSRALKASGKTKDVKKSKKLAKMMFGNPENEKGVKEAQEYDLPEHDLKYGKESRRRLQEMSRQRLMGRLLAGEARDASLA